MTVAELVAKLQTMPQEAEVVIQHGIDLGAAVYASGESVKEDDSWFDPVEYVGQTGLMNAYPNLPATEEWRRARDHESPEYLAVFVSSIAPDEAP